MTLEEALEILAALVREHVDFVVIGSMAMAASTAGSSGRGPSA